MYGLLSTGLLAVMIASAGSQIEARRIILEGVDRYRVREASFEGIRVILSHRGEEYSPAYICGISGAAFRISGPCPCAPTYGQVLWPTELIKLLGYESEQVWLQGENVDPEERLQEVLARVKKEIRSGQPVLIFHVFTNYEWDVVCGFDDEKEELHGRGSYMGLEEYAQAEQTHPLKSDKSIPLMGAIFIGEKTGQFDARAAEIAALKEAVLHAYGASGRCSATYENLDDGLQCYDRWVSSFRYFEPPGYQEHLGITLSFYLLSILQSTRRAASQFMLELAPKYPEVRVHLEMAAEHFARESEALESCLKLFPQRTQEELGDHDRCTRAAAYMRQARAMYELAINEIARALPKIGR